MCPKQARYQTALSMQWWPHTTVKPATSKESTALVHAQPNDTGRWEYWSMAASNMIHLSSLYAQNSHMLDVQQQSREQDRHVVILYDGS